jgi:hypothetical protein
MPDRAFAGQRACKGFFLLVSLAALLFPADGAYAQAPPSTPPEDVGSVDEYREMIPGAEGGRPVGDTSTRKAKTPLPSRVRETLAREGGSDAEFLEEVATASELGAPRQTAKRANRNKRNGAHAGRATPAGNDDEPSAPSAAASALTEEDGGRPIGLLVALIGIAAVVTGAAVYRHRRRGRLSADVH